MTAAMDAFAGSVLGDDEAGAQRADPEEQRRIVSAIAEDLRGDFPEDSYRWVFDVPWHGPVEVPFGEVDMSGRDRWRASREPEKVDDFARIMRDGGDELKPVLLVRWPGAEKYFCVDGHHRLLAGEESGVVRAFVADVPDDRGPWVTMHSKQLHRPPQ